MLQYNMLCVIFQRCDIYRDCLNNVVLYVFGIGGSYKSDNIIAAAAATAHMLHMKLQNSSSIYNFNTIAMYGDVDIISISFTISPSFLKTLYSVYTLSFIHSHAHHIYTHT